MYWAIVIIVIMILIANFIPDNKKNQKFQTFSSCKNDYSYKEYIQYLGGFPDLEGGKKAEIEFKKDGICIEFKNYVRRFIDVSNILNAEIETQQQISKELSLGKIICFGLFSLGMQNHKTITKNYLIITYKDKNINRNIILDSYNLEQLTQRIRKYALIS